MAERAETLHPAPLTRPAICLVTDRRVFGGDTSDAGVAVERMLGVIGACADGGVDLVQIRETGLTDRRLLALVREAMVRIRGTRARVVVNDRADIALAAGAAGVHLKDDARDASRIRAMGPAGWLIGRSVHDAATARAAAGGDVDYLIAGTVFASASKPGREPLGLDGLGAIVGAAAPCPVLAIGGVGVDNVREVAQAGAAGIAGIRLFRTDGVAERLTELCAAF